MNNTERKRAKRLEREDLSRKVKSLPVKRVLPIPCIIWPLKKNVLSRLPKWSRNTKRGWSLGALDVLKKKSSEFLPPLNQLFLKKVVRGIKLRWIAVLSNRIYCLKHVWNWWKWEPNPNDTKTFLRQGWLEPLLDRIARNSTTVVCPVIDVIDEDSLAIHFDKKSVQVGGFDWGLQVKLRISSLQCLP